MTETLQVGDLTFEVRRSLRRRTLGLTVDRGGDLLIHAPETLTAQDLQRWTKGKLLWVYRQLALKAEASCEVRPPEYVSGEGFTYLGRSYRLKTVADQKEPLRFDGKRFHLRSNARSDAAVHFRRWYISTGTEWLKTRVENLARKTSDVPARIAVRDLGYRWGSCGKNRVLFFNWKVLQLPVRLADYVIVHELIHLQEPNHGPEFWRALERALPDWKERQEELRTRAKDFLTFGMMAGI
jgi:predicted metal-dependent hydrolase